MFEWVDKDHFSNKTPSSELVQLWEEVNKSEYFTHSDNFSEEQKLAAQDCLFFPVCSMPECGRNSLASIKGPQIPGSIMYKALTREQASSGGAQKASGSRAKKTQDVEDEDSEDEGSSGSDEGEMAAMQRTLRNEKAKLATKVKKLELEVTSLTEENQRLKQESINHAQLLQAVQQTIVSSFQSSSGGLSQQQVSRQGKKKGD